MIKKTLESCHLAQTVENLPTNHFMDTTQQWAFATDGGTDGPRG